MTILANHDLVPDVRALCDRLGEARYRVANCKIRPGMVHAQIAPMTGRTVANVYLDTDDGQLLGTVMVKAGDEAWGADEALALLGTLLPEEAAKPVEAKPKTAAKARRTSRSA